MSTGRFVLIGVLAASGCTGEIMGGDDGGDDDGGEASVAITSPADGATSVRETLAEGGWLIADVPVMVTSSRVDAVEIAVNGEVVGTVDDTGALDVALRDLGATALTARAMRGGEVVAEAEVAVTVVDPTVDCHGWLDLYGLTYTLGPNNAGVSDPVTVTTPINGIPYRYSANTTQRATFFMDCSLARSLAKAAPYFRERDIVEVVDIGVYNYRCIGGEGTPPNCPQGMSQHAYAKAIDLAGFKTSDSTFYSVNDDFVIDPDGNTCTAPTEPGKDAFLHELICTLKDAGVWNIVLTPNYNSAHRNHFHVDLTAGSDFIRKRGGGIDDAPVSDH